MKNTPLQDRKRYHVAVFHKDGWDRYGGIRTFDSLGKAIAVRNDLLEMGWKNVHLWSVTTEMIQT